MTYKTKNYELYRFKENKTYLVEIDNGDYICDYICKLAKLYDNHDEVVDGFVILGVANIDDVSFYDDFYDCTGLDYVKEEHFIAFKGEGIL